jgi:hypothetical protein
MADHRNRRALTHFPTALLAGMSHFPARSLHANRTGSKSLPAQAEIPTANRHNCGMQRRWRYANVVTGKQARRQEKEMEWQLIVALVIMIPIILVPVAFVWYLNLGGMRLLLRAVRRTKIAGKERRAAPDEAR